MGDFQPGAASSVKQDGVLQQPWPEHVLQFWSRNLRIFGFRAFFFFPRLEKQHNNTLQLSCQEITSHSNKHKAYVCCIYLLLQPWAVTSQMLTRNKVHSFLSGHKMFPPQAREHFFGYLLGEAWHFHRDCNTVKPQEEKQPAETLFQGGRAIPEPDPWEFVNQEKAELLCTPTPSWAYLGRSPGFISILHLHYSL